MIGLGFGRRARAGYPDTDVGMLDVSANALAVLILATMLVITVAAPPAPPGEVQSDTPPDLFYPTPLEVSVAPSSTYWAVTDAGATVIDLDGFAVGLTGGATVARTPQGEATLVIDRSNYRDLNDHRLQLNLDWTQLSATAQPLATMQGVQDITAALRGAFDQDGLVPTFIVTPEGSSVFAQVYWELRKDRVPLRWVTVTSQSPLVLSRRTENFETRARQWQR
ncbi:hypothetical protein [Yoonia sp.]|uniref:hypothetical protein n=1 Tax=Yoonia sp. TaxID=2212373 RepID=UPI002FDA6A33